MRKSLIPLLALIAGVTAPKIAHAQPTLNGAVLYLADANGDPRTAGPTLERAYRTNPGVLNVYNSLFLTPNPDASYSAASFYNNGTTALSRQLTLGENSFYFYIPVSTIQGGVLRNLGLNLWFGTGLQSDCAEAPKISGLDLTNVSNNTQTLVANNSAFTWTQCVAPKNYIQGANTLSVITGLYNVSLTSFQQLSSGAVDRVSGGSLGSDGGNDTYGTFTLNVSSLDTPPTTTVPEPSTYLLMASGLAGVMVIARRRRRTS